MAFMACQHSGGSTYKIFRPRQQDPILSSCIHFCQKALVLEVDATPPSPGKSWIRPCNGQFKTCIVMYYNQKFKMTHSKKTTCLEIVQNNFCSINSTDSAIYSERSRHLNYLTSGNYTAVLKKYKMNHSYILSHHYLSF